MKILVTGGAGFIGSNFIHYWLKKYPDDDIANLDALTYAGNPENLKEHENNPRYTFIKGDVCDKELVNELVKGVDAIVHFAAESHVDRSILGPEVFVRTNVLGTHNLLEAARQNGNIRFHHVSTKIEFKQPPIRASSLWAGITMLNFIRFYLILEKILKNLVS